MTDEKGWRERSWDRRLRDRETGVPAGVAPDVRVDQDDAWMKLAFKEGAGPRASGEGGEGGKATGLNGFSRSLGTTEDTTLTLGLGEHG